MPTRLNPYINYQGNASEAIDFYQSVFGGKVDKTAFKNGGMPHDPAEADKLMHGMLETEGGIVLMVSDTPASRDLKAGSNISISLSGDDEAELQGYYEKLSSDGGAVTMTLQKAPWGDSFGMCTDKFGINWMVNITGGEQPTAG